VCVVLQINKFLPHVVAVGRQGTGKDALLVWDIYNLFYFKRSIFEPYFFIHGYHNYENEPVNVYSNCHLYLPYTPIKSVRDVEEAHDGVLYLHDLDLWFNSRGYLSKKDNPELLRLVNDMRKRNLQLRGSCHRIDSIDVKLRTLIHYWVVPDLVFIDKEKDLLDFDNYNIMYKVYDSDRVFLSNGFLDFFDFKRSVMFYNTNEEVRELVKG